MIDSFNQKRSNRWVNLKGERFGRLLVIKEAGFRGPRFCWLCLCDCGEEKVVPTGYLRGGNTSSCGCFRREIIVNRLKTHGDAGICAPEYVAWQQLIQRCTNPNSENWPRYGGRGISVCARWRSSYEAFLLDVGRRPSKEHSIDRIDNDGNYEPGNVRWATRSQQAKNRRHRSRTLVA